MSSWNDPSRSPDSPRFRPKSRLSLRERAWSAIRRLSLREKTPSAGNAPPAAFTRPTFIRYAVVAIVVAMAVLLYLDRFALSVATPAILTELNLNKEQMGYAIAAFFWAYALAQVPSGWLSDTLGARLTLAIYVVAWSLAIAMLGLVNGLMGLIVWRMLLGLGQAGAYPTAAGLLKNWIPLTSRGLANSAVSTGGRCGALLANAMTPPLMTLAGVLLAMSTGQWRAVFVLYSVLGLVWAVVFALWYRNSPREHRWCNEAEVDLIESGQGGTNRRGLAHFAESAEQNVPVPFSADESRWGRAQSGESLSVGRVPTENRKLKTENLPVPVPFSADGVESAAKNDKRPDTPRPPLPWREMLTSRNMWLLCAINFLVNVGWIFLATWLPTYLKEEHTAPLWLAGILTALTGLAGMCGGLSGGYLTDRLVARYGLVWGRRLPGIIATGAAALLYYDTLAFPKSLYILVAMFAAAFFAIDLGLGSIWSVFQDIGGRNVAAVLGFANMCGNLGAALFAIIIGMLADRGSWTLVFVFSSISFVLAMTCWFFVDPRRQLVASE